MDESVCECKKAAQPRAIDLDVRLSLAHDQQFQAIFGKTTFICKELFDEV